ncbi:MAG: OmpH family outer membrane protein [Alphaproteobacteria bacterium]|nr:OmpH family outer membrane protein [Alphaproteobacteria bacterium]
MRMKIIWQMRYVSGILLFGIMLSGLLPAVISTPSLAQDTTKTAVSIAIIDINGVLEQSIAIKKIRGIIDEENQKFLASTEEEQQSLRSEELELEAQRDILSEAEFNLRLKKFQDRVAVLQQKLQLQRREFDASLQQANEQLRKLLYQIITDITKENGYTLVIQKQNIVLYDLSIDISDEALSRLNERTKDMTVTFTNKDN